MKSRSFYVALLGLLLSFVIMLSGCARPSVEKLIMDKDISGLIDALGYDKGDAESYDNDIRKDAYDALIDVGEEAVPLLIKAIKNKNEMIISSAIEILADIKDERAVEPLIDVLDDEALEMKALFALCKIGSIKSIDALMEYSDQDIVKKGGLIEININYCKPAAEGYEVEATPYQSAEPGIHPVVIMDDGEFLGSRMGRFNNDPYNWNEYLPIEWQALGEPGSIQLVLTWGEIEKIILDEVYYGPATDPIIGKRSQEKRLVYLREAVTGRVVTSATLIGEQPDRLPDMVWDDWEDFEYLGKVTPKEVIDWLEEYVVISEK
ncbi:HEAT repeat domain-containing protein [Alkalibacter mobilis]|uniref:HEAT repeat domain-containing protein n=1 Tax=Alkalibacter mobilis TaxID=2787712 RepID=UPI0018A01CF1|nr:HEAT repeat domain-containing protein [Alkalibacter mobilis]MBF7096661.1 HEAT repeat domain-containing protein [Alkalibacter mobilis]